MIQLFVIIITQGFCITIIQVLAVFHYISNNVLKALMFKPMQKTAEDGLFAPEQIYLRTKTWLRGPVIDIPYDGYGCILISMNTNIASLKHAYS